VDDWGGRMFAFLHGASELLEVRAIEARLAEHLQRCYAISVSCLAGIEVGVFRVDRSDGPSWMARVFPRARPLEQVEGDAEILQFLADCGFPAERVAHREPVSVLDGHAVVVTRHVEGVAACHDAGTVHTLGQMLGRLHRLPEGSGAVMRSAGALHHWAPGGGGLGDNLTVASTWLCRARGMVTAADRGAYQALSEELAGAEDGRDLPETFIHPDYQPANILVDGDQVSTVIDWAGAGRGPRLAPLATLLWHAVARNPKGWDLRLVDAAVAGYRAHAHLDGEELARMAAMIQATETVSDCFYFGIGLRRLSEIAAGWPARQELAEAVARRAQRAFAL
jgi:Ser/Thr protein kinase RdoA (MazF antagonist)